MLTSEMHTTPLTQQQQKKKIILQCSPPSTAKNAVSQLHSAVSSFSLSTELGQQIRVWERVTYKLKQWITSDAII